MRALLRKASLSCLAVFCMAACSGGAKEWLTYENFEKIETGMTYEQVVKIFDGNKGKLQTSAGSGEYLIEDYLWQKNQMSMKFVIVGFMNKKVTSKTQTGLN